MFPDKYVKDIESSVKRNKSLKRIGIYLSFLTSLILIGPALHEAGHIIVLKAIGCSYFMNFGFSVFHGVYASIEPLCNPGTATLLVFYSTGYLLTLISGTTMILLGNEDRKYLTAAGTGFLLSVILTITIEGDVHSAAVLLGETYFEPLVTALIVLGVFVTSLRGLEKIV
ncbi:MAG: hypothetical protein ABEJ99_01345 [Candidatus Nanohaloarchaea archaeon]